MLLSAYKAAIMKTGTFIGTVMGIDFYEHPRYGGDAGLIAFYAGKAYSTDWYELPTANEIDEVDDFLACYS